MPQPTVEQFNAYEKIAATIATALEGLTTEQIHIKPAKDDWSINEIIAHLADVEVMVYTRARKIIAEDRPTLQVFPEDLWARGLLYQKQDTQLLATLLTMLRHANINLWTLLPPETWERTGEHPERGNTSLYDLFITYLQHSENHLNQIKENLQKQGISVQ